MHPSDLKDQEWERARRYFEYANGVYSQGAIRPGRQYTDIFGTSLLNKFI